MTDEQKDWFFVGTKEDRQHYSQKKIEEELIKRGEDLSEWNFFTIVRAPFARARSEVKYQLATQPKLRGLPNYKTVSKAIETGAIWKNCWKHHSRSATELLNGKSEVKVLKLETANKEFSEMMKEWTGEAVQLPELNKSKDTSKNELSQGAKLMLIQSWEGDFKKFGYHVMREQQLMSGWEKYVEYFNE